MLHGGFRALPTFSKSPVAPLGAGRAHPPLLSSPRLSSGQALAAEQSCWDPSRSGDELIFQTLLQALPQRAWLLLEEFQTGSGSRTELLGNFQVWSQARFPNLATNPATATSPFPAAIAIAVAILTISICFEVYIYFQFYFYIHFHICHFFDPTPLSSRGSGPTAVWLWWLLASCLLVAGCSMAGCSCLLLSARFLPKAPCQKLLAKSSLLPPCLAKSLPRKNRSPMRLQALGSDASVLLLTVSLRVLVAWLLQGPPDAPQISGCALGRWKGTPPSPLLSSPRLSSGQALATEQVLLAAPRLAAPACRSLPKARF